MSPYNLDLLYTIDTVEGAAIAAFDGTLIENQLAASLTLAERLASAAAEYLRGMAIAQRTCLGAALVYEPFHFLIAPARRGILIVQIEPGALFRPAWAAIEQLTLEESETPIDLPIAPVPTQSPDAIWPAYRLALGEILAEVAPPTLAQSILDGAEEEAGLSEGEVPSLSVMQSIAHLSMTSILNPGSRKLVFKKLQALHAAMGLEDFDAVEAP
jgi:predicted regulator of Ras-like GTPase activity (Roadblock/LC7/MglB family)